MVLRTVLLRMSETTRVTEKGQATIPQEVRDALGIEPGDVVVWDEKDGKAVVTKRDKSRGRGMLAEDADENERREIAEALTDEIRERQHDDWNPE